MDFNGNRQHAVRTRDGRELLFWDRVDSSTVPVVWEELIRDDYGVSEIPFRAGDVVIDVGGNVGVVAIMLALAYPDISIYVLEPNPGTFNNLVKNLQYHRIRNVKAYPLGLSADGRPIAIFDNVYNSGGSSSFITGPGRRVVQDLPTIMLDDFVKSIGVAPIRWLKCDAEGAEWESLPTASAMSLVEYLSLEYHPLPGRNASKLIQQIAERNPNLKVKVPVTVLPNKNGVLRFGPQTLRLIV